MTYQPVGGNADRSAQRAAVEAKLAELGVDGTGDVVIPRERVLADPGGSCDAVAQAANDMGALGDATDDPALAAAYYGVALMLEQRYQDQCVMITLPPNGIGGEILPG